MFKFIPDPGRRRVSAFAALNAAFFLALLVPASLPAQAPSQGFPFRATNYEVEVLLHPDDQTISGLAKVEFVAQQVSRTVVVELHQDLKINSVNVPGGTLRVEWAPGETARLTGPAETMFERTIVL